MLPIMITVNVYAFSNILSYCSLVQQIRIIYVSFSFEKCKHVHFGNGLSLNYNLMDYNRGERIDISSVDKEKGLRNLVYSGSENILLVR